MQVVEGQLPWLTDQPDNGADQPELVAYQSARRFPQRPKIGDSPTSQEKWCGAMRLTSP